MNDNATDEQTADVVNEAVDTASVSATVKVKKPKRKTPDRFADGGVIPGGAQSAAVGRAQRLLGVTVTSRVDHATKAALRAIQREAGLPVNGRLDVATRNHLGV